MRKNGDLSTFQILWNNKKGENKMFYVRETPNGKKQYINLAGFRPVTEEEISVQMIKAQKYKLKLPGGIIK